MQSNIWHKDYGVPFNQAVLENSPPMDRVPNGEGIEPMLSVLENHIYQVDKFNYNKVNTKQWDHNYNLLSSILSWTIFFSSIYLPIYLKNCLYIILSINSLCIYKFIYLHAHLSIYLSQGWASWHGCSSWSHHQWQWEICGTTVILISISRLAKLTWWQLLKPSLMIVRNMWNSCYYI